MRRRRQVIPSTWQYLYRGPNVNATGATTPRRIAIRQVWSWFEARVGLHAGLAADLPAEPGDEWQSDAARSCHSELATDLATPNNIEYAVGVSRQFGARASARADYVYRNYSDFYISRIDQSTGRVTNAVGQSFDLALIENDVDREVQAGLSRPH